MIEVILVAAVTLPFALLVMGFLLLGMAMPSARDTLARRGWTAPVTLALIGPAALLLVFLLAWRGDSETSAWADSGTDLRAVAVAALAMGGVAVAVQWWVMVRYADGVASRVRSAGAALGGVAMLALFAALVAAWLAASG